MSVVFAVRGTSKNAYYTGGSAAPTEFGTNSVDAGAGTGIIGNSVINLDQGSFAQHSLLYSGRNSLPLTQKFSILCRCALGDVTNALSLFWFGQGGNNNVIQLRVLSGTTLAWVLTSSSGSNFINASSTTTYTTGTFYDFVVTLDTSLTTGAGKIYQDGTLVATVNASSVRAAIAAWAGSGILLGAQNASSGNSTRMKLNEFVIWDTIIDPTSGGLNLNGSSRSSFISVANFEGGVYVDPTPSSVKIGAGYTFAGVAQTGIYDGSDRYTDFGNSNIRSGHAGAFNSLSNNRLGTVVPAAAATTKHGVTADDGAGSYQGDDVNDVIADTDLKHGVTKLNRNVSVTGSYRGADLWEAVTSDVLPVGVTVLQNGSEISGDLVLPTTGQVKHEVSFGVNGGAEGTYRGADLWEAIAAEDLRSGVSALQDGEEVDGLITLPEAGDIKHGVGFGENVGTYRGEDLWEAVTAPELELGVKKLQNGVEVIGTLGGDGIRDFLDSILDTINAETLTDDEFGSIDDDLAEEYSKDTYEALRFIVETREGVSDQAERLKALFIARGVELADPAKTPTSNIFIGGSLG